MRINSLNRREDAVSPVIATILMVAITVVLAATLYMMVGDIGAGTSQNLTGNLTHRGNLRFEISSLQIPSSAELSDVEIIVLHEDGELNIDGDWTDEEGNHIWNLLSDGKMVSNARFDLTKYTGGEYEFNGDDLTYGGWEVEEVVIRIDGYGGVLRREL